VVQIQIVALNTTEPGAAGGLVENSLNESLGVSSYVTDPEQQFVFGFVIPPYLNLGSTGGAVDWNNNEQIQTALLSLDINDIKDSSSNPVCPTESPSPGQVLTGYNDWDNLTFDFRGYSHFFEGRSTGTGVRDDQTIMVFANGIDELNRDNVRAARVVGFDLLENMIVGLDPSHFHVNSQANSIKSGYQDRLANAKGLIVEGLNLAAIEALDKERRTFDGKGPTELGVGPEHKDLIITPGKQKDLLDRADAIRLSLIKSLDYLPTTVHPGIPPCSTITTIFEDVTYDIPYCIKNGVVTDATIGSQTAIGKLTVTVDAQKDSWVTMDISNIKNDDRAARTEGLQVSVNGVPVFFDNLENYGVHYTTLPLNQGINEIEIIGKMIVPEFELIASLILAIAIMSIIALTAKTRLRLMPKLK